MICFYAPIRLRVNYGQRVNMTFHDHTGMYQQALVGHTITQGIDDNLFALFAGKYVYPTNNSEGDKIAAVGIDDAVASSFRHGKARFYCRA
jgi:hypothetical protein